MSLPANKISFSSGHLTLFLFVILVGETIQAGYYNIQPPPQNPPEERKRSHLIVIQVHVGQIY
jgi:hypothetical protein